MAAVAVDSVEAAEAAEAAEAVEAAEAAKTEASLPPREVERVGVVGGVNIMLW